MNPPSSSDIPPSDIQVSRQTIDADAPEPSVLDVVGDKWPHLLLGTLLAMGIIGLNPEAPGKTSPLIWLPPALLLGWLAVHTLIIAPAKRHKIEEYDTVVSPDSDIATDAVKTPAAAEAVSADTAIATPAAAAPAKAAPAAESVLSGFSGVAVLWGSETGNSQGLADTTQARLTEAGLAARSIDIGKVKLADLQQCKQVLILTSTWGDGEPPSNAIDLWEALQKQKVDLSGLSFSVLALGDTGYPQFCQCGKDFDKFLEAQGAKRIHPRVDCDLEYEAPYEKWVSGVTKALQAQPAIA